MLSDIVSGTYMGPGRGRENQAICPLHYVFKNKNSEKVGSMRELKLFLKALGFTLLLTKNDYQKQKKMLLGSRGRWVRLT
jgi:hypothetical protein